MNRFRTQLNRDVDARIYLVDFCAQLFSDLRLLRLHHVTHQRHDVVTALQKLRTHGKFATTYQTICSVNAMYPWSSVGDIKVVQRDILMSENRTANQRKSTILKP